MADLTLKEQLFVEEYLQRMNATQAAIAAGYSRKTARQQGSRLLTNVDIAAAVQERLDEAAAGADEVLRKLTDHLRGTMKDFTVIDAEGLPMPDWRKAKKLGLLHLVKSFTRTTETRTVGKGEDAMQIVTVTVKTELYDVQAAANLLGKHHRLFDRAQEVDWQRELANAGLDATDEFNQLKTRIKARLAESNGSDDGAGDAGGAAGA